MCYALYLFKLTETFWKLYHTCKYQLMATINSQLMLKLLSQQDIRKDGFWCFMMLSLNMSTNAKEIK